MSQHLVITAIGTDRPGMCNEIVSLVANAEGNIVDSRIAIFGGECTLIMLVSGTVNAITRIEAMLPLYGQDNDIITMTKRTTPHPTQTTPYVMDAHIEADDKVGLTEQFTQFFADKNIGLSALSAQTIDKSAIKKDQDQCFLSIEAKLGEEIDLQQLKSAFEDKCATLSVNGTINFTKHTP
ncbi:glycine cleavage system transcriptional repressor [Vibrio sp. S4M6]|uniref:glycine cleavage system protein R n=1 Tax=Vibrio sinus TaxID=2946865 RepID=UPI00202AA155|nr:ACT domain-containing protein [Vibrio sinus]MCL9782523.1 glycine cleavage system transcriptional repressor [Vibrio sinus]